MNYIQDFLNFKVCDLIFNKNADCRSKDACCMIVFMYFACALPCGVSDTCLP